MYDYWIQLPNTPAFEENIQAMTDLIAEDGESPTIQERETGNEKGAAIGTKQATGKELLHFRLSARYDETELIDYLESVMSNPIPPITVEAIRSAYKIIPILEDEEVVGHEYETIVPPNKAHFLPYMNDIDGTPPNASDDLFLSGYLGSDPIALQ